MEKEGVYVDAILRYLPGRIAAAVQDFAARLSEHDVEWISELRLRAGAPFSLTYRGRNICRFGGAFLFSSESEVTATLQRLCEDSIHTYSETLKDGYVALDGGYRIGVCGKTGGEGARGIYGISALAIRIPHPVSGVGEEMISLLTSNGGIASALFYAPPNVGKTTLVRDIGATLAGDPYFMRIVIVDSRRELALREMFCRGIADFLIGYPKAKGIAIATRTLSPEAIICDEIGGEEEARAILASQNSGVSLIATAHGDSFASLMRRPNIRILYENGVFRYYVGISRPDGETKFHFEIHDSLKA